MKKPAQKPSRPAPAVRPAVIARQEESSTTGCALIFVLVAAVIGGIVWLARQEPSGTTEALSSGSKAISKAATVTEKANGKPSGSNSIKISTEEKSEPATAKPKSAGVSAAVQNMGELTAGASALLPPATAEEVDRALAAQPLCYHGRMARRVPSLFDRQAFAITYGSDDFNSGDRNPFPRLEVFHYPHAMPVMASVMSMTESPIREFPDNHEIPLAYDNQAIGKQIARWVVAVATETCPPKKAP